MGERCSDAATAQAAAAESEKAAERAERPGPGRGRGRGEARRLGMQRQSYLNAVMTITIAAIAAIIRNTHQTAPCHVMICAPTTYSCTPMLRGCVDAWMFKEIIWRARLPTPRYSYCAYTIAHYPSRYCTVLHSLALSSRLAHLIIAGPCTGFFP